MRIGELARRAGTTTRQLRYYEEQGLLSPDRASSNYRDFDEASIEIVSQIRGLIEAGMPTRVIRVLLPCVDGPAAEMSAHDNPEMAEMLKRERARLQDNIERLKKTREQVDCYLSRVRPESGVDSGR